VGSDPIGKRMVVVENSQVRSEILPDEFYSKLKFMVFKIKQRATTNYSKYKEDQLLEALRHNVLEKIDTTEEISIEGVPVNRHHTNEVYGANWPYDHFSLLEGVKLDIKVKVK